MILAYPQASATVALLDPTGGSRRAPTVESHAGEFLQGGCVPSAM